VPTIPPVLDPPVPTIPPVLDPPVPTFPPVLDPPVPTLPPELVPPLPSLPPDDPHALRPMLVRPSKKRPLKRILAVTVMGSSSLRVKYPRRTLRRLIVRAFVPTLWALSSKPSAEKFVTPWNRPINRPIGL
jgi:hypothetical protein